MMFSSALVHLVRDISDDIYFVEGATSRSIKERCEGSAKGQV
jgi:hypothetical protein